MKKILLISCLLLCLYANQTQAQVRFGIKGGINSSLKATGEGAILANYRPVWGWQAGITADIPLSRVLSLRSAVSYSAMGNVVSEPLYRINPAGSYYVDMVTYTTRVSYLQIPALALFKVVLNDKLNLLAGAGSYAAMALRVKLDNTFEFNGMSQQITNKEPLDIDNNLYYSRFDYGLSGTVGIEFYNRIQMAVGYDYGLANVSGRYMNVPTFNRNANLSVSYFF